MASSAGKVAALPSPRQFSRTQVVNEHVFLVTLNRPDRLNALHNEVSSTARIEAGWRAD